MAESAKKSGPTREQQARERQQREAKLLKAYQKQETSQDRARRQIADASESSRRAAEDAFKQQQFIEAENSVNQLNNESVETARQADKRAPGELPEAPIAGPVDVGNPIRSLGNQRGAAGIQQTVRGGAAAQQALQGLQGGGQALEVPQTSGGGLGTAGTGGGPERSRTSGGNLTQTQTTQEFRAPNFLDNLFGGGGAPIETSRRTVTTSRPDVLSEYQRARVDADFRSNTIRVEIATRAAEKSRLAAEDAQAKLDGESLGGQLYLGNREAVEYLQQLQAAQDPYARKVASQAANYLTNTEVAVRKQIASRAPSKPLKLTESETVARLRAEGNAALAVGDLNTANFSALQLRHLTQGDVTVNAETGQLEFPAPVPESPELKALTKEAREAQTEYINTGAANGAIVALLNGIRSGHTPAGGSYGVAKIGRAFSAAKEFVTRARDLDIPVPAAEALFKQTLETLDDDIGTYGDTNPELADIKTRLLAAKLKGLSAAELVMTSLQYSYARSLNGPGVLANQDLDRTSSNLSLGGIFNPSSQAEVIGALEAAQLDVTSRHATALAAWKAFAPGRDIVEPVVFAPDFLSRGDAVPDVSSKLTVPRLQPRYKSIEELENDMARFSEGAP